MGVFYTRVAVAADINRDRAAIQEAAQLLRAGKLVVIPTETVYGIGADAFNREAVARIFVAKGRPQDNPLIAHIAALEQLRRLAVEIPPEAYKLAMAFWPGPFTVILKKSAAVPDIVSAGLDTVAVRMPAHPIAREIIRLSGTAVAAPSANLSGKPSPTTALHCIEDLTGKVEMIVDGGPCKLGVESTVLSLVSAKPRILRPGAVTPAQIEEALGCVPELDPAVLGSIQDDAPVSSPGMKYKHYAPQAEVTMLTGETALVAAFLKQHSAPGTFALAFDEDLGRLPVPTVAYGPRNDGGKQASRLFAALRELDEMKAVKVYARTPPSRVGVGLAVYNRLARAAAFREIIL